MSKFIRIMVIFLSVALFNSANAAPKTIILVRHGDKLIQPEPGPCLSAKGQVRAMALAFYFLKNFGEPDYIIATNPANEVNKNSSLRELETVSPLANMLAEKYPEKGYPILHSYMSTEIDKLSYAMLHQPQFNNKKILICWNHGRIPQLAKALGVKQKLAPWPANDFDSVYLLNFDAQGNVSEFKILNQQYPVVFNGSWQVMYSDVTHS